jgi:hypothetical protein
LVLHASKPHSSPDPRPAWQGGARPSRTLRAAARLSTAIPRVKPKGRLLTAERRLAPWKAGRDGGMVSSIEQRDDREASSGGQTINRTHSGFKRGQRISHRDRINRYHYTPTVECWMNRSSTSDPLYAQQIDGRLGNRIACGVMFARLISGSGHG